MSPMRKSGLVTDINIVFGKKTTTATDVLSTNVDKYIFNNPLI